MTVLGPLPGKRSARLTATVIHSHFYFYVCTWKGKQCAIQRTELTDRSNGVLADQTSLPARHKLRHMKKEDEKEKSSTTAALTGLLRHKTRDVSTAQAQRGTAWHRPRHKTSQRSRPDTSNAHQVLGGSLSVCVCRLPQCRVPD